MIGKFGSFSETQALIHADCQILSRRHQHTRVEDVRNCDSRWVGHRI